MSQEPNSKMDELLRAYAKKRREQAEPALQMHPATRKLLQDEVKRTLGAAPPPPRTSWQVWRWPLLALGGGFAALLVMFAVINTQMQHLLPATAHSDRNLSQARPMLKAPAQIAGRTASPAPIVSAAEQKEADFKPPAAPPAAVSGTIVAATPVAPAQATSETPLMDTAAAGRPSSLGSLNDAKLASSAPAPVADKSKSVSAAPAVGSLEPKLGEMPAPVAATTTGAQAGVPIAAPALPPTFAADEIAPATALPAAASEGSDLAGGEFVQIHDRAQEKAAQSPLSNVLSVFQLRRSGQNVRIVDADGSVYVGQVLSGNTGDAGLGAGGGGARFGMAKKRKDTNEDANWGFKVMGTNNHLQQNVVFTGNVQPMPAAATTQNAAARNRNASQLQNAPAGAPVPSAQNSRITGKVQVGGGKEFKIEAKPPAP